MNIASSQGTQNASSYTTLPHRCGIENCRTRRYRRDPADGHLYCRYGHQQPAAPETQIEDDEVFQSQSIRITKRKADPSSDAESIADGAGRSKSRAKPFLKGRSAAELCLDCFQLLLRKQVFWLVHHKDVGSEFEGLVKALWTLRLQVHVRWIAEKLGERPDSSLELFSSQQSRAQSSGDDSVDNADADGMDGKNAKSQYNRPEPPRWEDLLCLIYFALVLLRSPITLRDILDWAAKENFPYRNPERLIPKDVLHRLDINWRRRLYLRNRALQPGDLHRRTLQLAYTFAKPPINGLPGIDLPPLNHILLLHHWICELSLPLNVFPAVESFIDTLAIDHLFPEVLQPRGELPIVFHPELRLLALIMLAVKIYHPFDGIPRHPTSPDSLNTMVINWDIWNQQHASLSRLPLHPEKVQQRGPNDHWDVKPNDVVLMNTGELDDYLDWFERTWLPPTSTDDPTENATNDFDKEMFRLFPLPKKPNANSSAKEQEVPQAALEEREALARTERTKIVAANLIIRDAVPPDENSGRKPDRKGKAKEKERRKWQTGQEVARPGDNIKEWSTIDDVEETAKVFVERCAYLGAIDAGTLVKTVAGLERGLRNHVRAQEKAERKEKREAKRRARAES